MSFTLGGDKDNIVFTFHCHVCESKLESKNGRYMQITYRPTSPLAMQLHKSLKQKITVAVCSEECERILILREG